MKQKIKKLNLYLETSIWNFIYADDAPDKRDITKCLFEEIKAGRYEIFISDLVSAEIEDAPEPVKRKLLTFIYEMRPKQLISNHEVEQLANAYFKAKVTSQNALADVLHVAHAVVHNMDVVVSWNLRHIVRLKTKLAVNGVNKMMGYREIEIVTPEEVIDYGND